MRIARTMQMVGYALYGIAGLEPVIDSKHPTPPEWLVAYALLGLAFHAGASVPNDEPHRRRRFAALAVMTPPERAFAISARMPLGGLVGARS